ncbi:MAG: PTS sugar transporter subunit IIA [Breznakia sp.]
MKEMKKMFQLELVNLDVVVKDKADFFQMLAKKLLEKGYVEETFEMAIMQREKNYPTGLKLENIAIAIPHTDVIHIKKAFVCVNRLASPIEFMQMGSDDVVLAVSDIFVLGIKEPKRQVKLLALLMELFSDREFIYRYRQASTEKEINSLFLSYINN